MATLKITAIPGAEETKQLKEAFGDYVKVVVDLENGMVYAGCKLHSDAEKLLLEEGSKQESIWGGGVDLETKEADALAMINIRPSQGNPSHELLDHAKRTKFFSIVGRYFRIEK